MKEPKVIERFTDNGGHSHYELIDVETGDILWSEEMEALRQTAVIKSVCVCKNRQDQFKRGDAWICGDCEEEIKQTVL